MRIAAVVSSAIAAAALAAGYGPAIASPREIPQAVLERAYDEAHGRVVGVSYTLKPMEVSEMGLEGPRADGILCGVVAAPGLIVIPGDIFPEPGGDPRSTLAPAEFEIHIDKDTTIEAKAVGLDRKLNLAFLSFEPGENDALRPVRFPDTGSLAIGDEVIVVGLLARKYDFAPALYRGSINARVDDPVTLLGVDIMLPDLAVGGLVLRSDGSAAGIVAKDLISENADLSQVQGNFIALLANSGQPPFRRPGYAMVLPHASFAERLSAPPPVDLEIELKRAWLGIVMQALDKDLIEYWGLPVSGGIIIGNVVEGSPARSAGIRQGDILTRFGGEEIRITDNSQLGDFRKRVERMAAGEEVAAQIYRDGKPVDITIQLGDAPTSAALAEDYEDDDFGLTVRELTMDVRQAMNLERDLQGVFIEGTEDSGWADVAGLYPQDIILAINGVRVASVADVRDAIEDIKHRRDPEAIFFVMRPPDTLFLRVRTEFRATRSTVVDGQ
jgi:S1-C subfamily serine protease